MKRMMLGIMTTLLVLLPAMGALAKGPQVTIGLLPKLTKDDRLTIRGIAPRGQEVVLMVNGVEVVRTKAAADMDRYFEAVGLKVGENTIEVYEAKDPSNRTSVEVFRATIEFSDMNLHPAGPEAAMLATLGVVNGIGDGKFGPDLDLTRAQFAKMVVLGLGLPVVSGADLPFKDKEQIPDWARDFVATAVKAGLLNGYEDGTFRPHREISRVELAVIASRGLRLKGIEEQSPLSFADLALIPAWAAADVAMTVHAKLIGGFEDNTFRPAQKANRGETAVLVRRLMTAKK